LLLVHISLNNGNLQMFLVQRAVRLCKGMLVNGLCSVALKLLDPSI